MVISIRLLFNDHVTILKVGRDDPDARIVSVFGCDIFNIWGSGFDIITDKVVIGESCVDLLVECFDLSFGGSIIGFKVSHMLDSYGGNDVP